MLAPFQSLGTQPTRKDRLIKRVSEGAISEVHSFKSPWDLIRSISFRLLWIRHTKKAHYHDQQAVRGVASYSNSCRPG